MELALLQEEVQQLRLEANHAALIAHFTELMYDAQDEDEVITILLHAIPQIIPFSELRYFEIDKKELALKEKYFLTPQSETPVTVTEGLISPLNFFGGLLADSVLNGEFITMENGIAEEDELSIRFNCDRYLIVPLTATQKLKKKLISQQKLSRNSFRTDDAYLRACVNSPDYPVLGALWINISELPDTQIASGISLLTSLLHTSGAVVGELRMVDQIVTTNERIDKDLRAAREVQMGLLPSSLPKNDHIQAEARYLTEEQVGGDYYDIFELSPGIYGLMVADASGHGTPSALIMTMTKILLKTFADEGKSPSETLELINTAIVNNAKTNKFITAFYAILDTTKNELHSTSAGHCPQFLLNKKYKSAEKLCSDGVFIGMFPFLQLKTHTRSYVPGENRLVLYTDGLTESTNGESQMYGDTRLINSGIASLENSPEEALDSMLQRHKRYIRNNPKDDDLTLMLVDF